MMNFKHWIFDYLITHGFTDTSARYLNMMSLLLILLFFVFLTDFIIRKIIVSFFTSFANRSKSNFDDILVKNKVPRNIAHIIPLLLALEFVPHVLVDFQYAENIIEKTLKVFSIILALWIVRSILNALKGF